MRTRYGVTPVAVAGLTLAAFWLVLHGLGVGGWKFQLTAFRIFAPILAFVPVWLAWQSARHTRLPGARRYSLLTGAAWSVLTLSGVFGVYQTLIHGNVGYPTQYPIADVADLVTLVLVLAALLTVPVRNRWSASRLRLGLDMGTVMLAGAIFLWYFVVAPNFGASGGGSFDPVAIFAQNVGVLVALFAIARLMLGGVVEVSRAALLLSAAAGVVNVGVGILRQALSDPRQMHFILAGWALFTGFLMASGLAQVRSVRRGGTPGAAAAQRPSSMLPYLAVTATYVLLVVALLGGLDARSWAVLAGAIVLTGLVVARQIVAVRDNARLMVRLDDSLHALRRSMAREQVLGDLGTALLTTTAPAEVHRLAADAAGALLVDCPGAWAGIISVPPDDPDNFAVVHAAGVDAAATVGSRTPVADVPTALLARLADGQVVSGAGLAGITGLDQDAKRAIVLLPLLHGERFFGLLGVSSDIALPDDLVKSLQTLRTQASLALDSVALTAELTKRAMYDALTGLGNRRLLWDRLEAALARSRRNGRPVAALLLDLNGFKLVNDTYGHDAGDELLKVVADRLRVSVRTEDIVGRLGGDEFVVIAEDLRDTADAVVIAERIVAALNECVEIGGNLMRTPASIGIALSDEATLRPDDLLSEADAAMYTAKRRGGGRYHVRGTAEEERPGPRMARGGPQS